MRVRYKVIQADAEQKDFMRKYKVCACTWCDYSEGWFCTFTGKKCPAGKYEYLQKIFVGVKKITNLKFKL